MRETVCRRIVLCSPAVTPSRFALSAVNMEQTDYDSRTALHIAAAEGDTSLSSHVHNPQYKGNAELGFLCFVLQVT